MTERATNPAARATLTVTEAGELLGCSRGTAYKMARQGTLPTLRLGRRLVVPRVAFDRWLASAHLEEGAVEEAGTLARSDESVHEDARTDVDGGR